jgi:hypothetical protein
MCNRLLIASLVILGLTACAPQSSKPPAPPADPCADIARVLQSYQTGFADIREQKRSYDRLDIWSSTFQLVGTGCEIWGWQGGQYNYVCNYTAPDEQSALAIYNRAEQKIATCASSEWQRNAHSTQEGSGRQTVWQHHSASAMVDLRLVQTRGIGKPSWAIYLLIGDYNAQM